MVNFQELLEKIVLEIPTSELDRACEKAGIGQENKELVLDYLYEVEALHNV